MHPTGRAGRNLQELADVKKHTFDAGCLHAGVPTLVRRRSLAGLGRDSATLVAQYHIGAGLLRTGLPPRVWSLHPQRHRVCAARGCNAARGSDAASGSDAPRCSGATLYAARGSGAALYDTRSRGAVRLPPWLLSWGKWPLSPVLRKEVVNERPS
jgi:hypothetical protein